MINYLGISMSAVPTVPIEQINLKEYRDYMKKGQYDICYIAGENIDRVFSLPFIETMRKKELNTIYVDTENLTMNISQEPGEEVPGDACRDREE
eukprot:8219347-Heterocapsa_arctica.AAC.1